MVAAALFSESGFPDTSLTLLYGLEGGAVAARKKRATAVDDTPALLETGTSKLKRMQL